MRIFNAVLFLLISGTWSISGAGSAAIAQQASPTAPPPAATPSPAAILQPALDAVQQSLATIKVEKWKRGSVRDEAGDHIQVIQRDLKETMPPLLTAASAAPGSVSAQLPVSRNVDAVYDILLSVVEAARVVGQPAQVTDLDQALRGLNAARVKFDEQVQAVADASEKQIVDLQTTVKAQAAVKCPVLPPPVVPACPAPAAKKPVHRKPKPPATTTPATPGTATAPPATTKPSS